MSFEKVSGRGVYVEGNDIDTDRIIPARFLKCVTFDELGPSLFYDERFDSDGKSKNHALDLPEHAGAEILISDDNFGCGSSREHAPWALSDFGIKCIISTSFADIFYNNSFKNGLLPIKVSAEDREALMADAKDRENPELEIDLPSQEIRRPNGSIIKFEIDPFRKKCLLEGLDDIGLTMQKSDEIATF